MSGHYSIVTFFHLVSSELLAEYCERTTKLRPFAKHLRSDLDYEGLFERWQEIPLDIRNAAEAEFEEVHGFANDDGIALLRRSISHRSRDAAAFDGLKSAHDKALWLLLKDEAQFKRSIPFLDMNDFTSLQWSRWPDLPKEKTEKGAEQKLALKISALLKAEEGRGSLHKAVRVDRPDGAEFFFVYLDDYPAAFVGFDEKEKFTRKLQRPAFEVIVVFEWQKGTLDIYAAGGEKRRKAIRDIFLQDVLGVTEDIADPTVKPYDLDVLKKKRFKLPVNPADGILAARVRRLRICPTETPKDQIILVSPVGGGGDVSGMVKEYLNRRRLSMKRIAVTLVQIEFLLAPEKAGRKSRRVAFNVSTPRHSSYHSRGERIRVLAERYLKEWKIDAR